MSDQIFNFYIGDEKIRGVITSDVGAPSDAVFNFSGPNAKAFGEQVSVILAAEADRHVQELNAARRQENANAPQWRIEQRVTASSDAIPDAQFAQYRFRLKEAGAPEQDAPALTADPLVNVATRVISELAQRTETQSLDEALQSYRRDHRLPVAASSVEDRESTLITIHTPDPKITIRRILQAVGAAQQPQITTAA